MLPKMFHYLTVNFRCSVLLFIHFQITMANTVQKLSDEIIPELYLKYKEAVSDDNSTSSARRLFKNNKLYEVHVKRLKDVNGFKVHNLMIKEEEESNNNALIYINNPVESRIPKAFLTLEEFKNALYMRAQAHKDILATETNLVNTNGVNLKSTPIKKLSNKFYTTKLFTVRVNCVIRSTNNTNEDVLENTIIETTKYLFTETNTAPSKGTENFKTQITEKNANEFDSSTSVKTAVLRTSNHRDIAASLDQTPGKENLPKVDEVIKKTTQRISKVSIVSKAMKKEVIRHLDNSTSITKPDLRTSILTQSYEPSENLTKDIKITTSYTVPSYTKILFNKTITKFIDLSTSLKDSVTELDQMLVNENLPKVTEVTKKKTPKRLKVSRVSKAKEKLTTSTTKRKRSTLGRPLVFMGGPDTF